MSNDEQVDQFANELDAIVNRFRAEYDLTYGNVVGVLQMKIYLLCKEAEEASNEI